jgi:hypothetical protein
MSRLRKKLQKVVNDSGHQKNCPPTVIRIFPRMKMRYELRCGESAEGALDDRFKAVAKRNTPTRCQETERVQGASTNCSLHGSGAKDQQKWTGVRCGVELGQWAATWKVVTRRKWGISVLKSGPVLYPKNYKHA